MTRFHPPIQQGLLRLHDAPSQSETGKRHLSRCVGIIGVLVRGSHGNVNS